tara:strand:- start:6970 stop:8049 length:1080 start_codon:yes stop_codon:yes gene_type:complete
MKTLKKIIKTSRHLLYIAFNTNWIGYYKFCKKGSKNVVISNFFTSGKFSTEGICWEFGYINYFIKNQIEFEYTSLRKPLFEKNIYWSPEITTTPINIRNYTSLFVHIAKELESQGCRVYPNSYEINFLENKVFMHEQFKLKDIPHPKTSLLSSYNPNLLSSLKPNDNIEQNIDFPLIWKGEHSAGSRDIKLIESIDDLKTLINQKDFQIENPNLILQQFFDIRKDLRVNVIGNEVVLCFWRMNKSSTWKPTASEFGAKINYNEIPTHLFKQFVAITKKLDLNIAGFDVIFEDDDVNKPFKILEVSPRYSPNPKFDVSDKNYTYSQFKSRIFTRRSWAYLQSQEIFKHAFKYAEYINNQS